MSRLSSPAGLANEAATLSERLVSITAASNSIVLDRETYANRTILINGNATSLALTMPHAYGSGDRYEFVLATPQTSNGITISLAHGVSSNAYNGSAYVHDASSANTTIFSASAGLEADRITLNTTTTGGLRAGDRIVLVDSAVGTWQVVEMKVSATGAVATPFSAP